MWERTPDTLSEASFRGGIETFHLRKLHLLRPEVQPWTEIDAERRTGQKGMYKLKPWIGRERQAGKAALKPKHFNKHKYISSQRQLLLKQWVIHSCSCTYTHAHSFSSFNTDTHVKTHKVKLKVKCVIFTPLVAQSRPAKIMTVYRTPPANCH